MSEIKYGLLHCHTDNSMRDSVMSIDALISRAKELGAPAIALTDHGNMTGYIEFMDKCRAEGIKPIVGVETYVEEMSEGRRHLILMAKDYTGFQALIKAVTESNKRADKVGTNIYPRMDKDILYRYFGPGSSGHGHVIATSACVNGILAGILSMNEGIDAKTVKLTQQRDRYTSPDSLAYKKNSERLEELQSEQKELAAQIKACTDALKKAETKDALRERTAALPEGSKSRMKNEERLAAIEKNEEEAMSALPELKEKKAKLDAQVSSLKEVVKSAKDEIAKWTKKQAEIDAVTAPRIKDDELESSLRKEALWYKENFGDGCFYIELSYHGLHKEKEIMPKLADLSTQLDIPVCISNDAHMPTNSPDDVLARRVIKATMFNKWEEAAADKEYYIKTDAELISSLEEIIPVSKVTEGYTNIGAIVNACNLEIPEGNHYPVFEAPEGYTPESYLRKLAEDGLEKRYGEVTDEIRERMEYELFTIISMGYASYLCIVEDFLRYARAVGKLDLNDPKEQELALTFDTALIQKKTVNRAGEGVGPGRGSAAGSLVCYLIGITDIDPLKYGLLFERFLNPERVSMPDIDCDISGNVRPYVILYVKHRYGENSVCGIMTKMKLMGKSAIRTGGRVYGIRQSDDSTAYDALTDEIADKAAELYGSDINVSIAPIKDALDKQFAKSSAALEIIKYASLIEGACTQIGQHAAGIIITDGHPVDDYVPLVYGEANDMMMTQCDMTQAESIGLLKMDFLGLNNLTIISEALQDILKDTGKCVDMGTIKEEPEVFSEIFDKGMTNSVFQFESQGMKQMLKSFKPDCIEDLILLVAMYRPGPLQFLQDVIDVKNGRKKAEYLTPRLKPILKDTYGSITYQEQVQEVFKQLAGYSLGQADVVRRAMAKKKEKVLKSERTAFMYGDKERNIAGCLANGISEEVSNALFDELTKFSSYAFNKSHAACYATVAYQTAWLKYHYPEYYMKAVLNNTPFEKYPGLFDDLKEMGINILQPDANLSGTDFSIENGDIRYGLGKIKGLGSSVKYLETERRENGFYTDMTDFVCRTMPDKKVLSALTDAGAFDSFCENRAAMSDVLEEYLAQVKKMRAAANKASGEPEVKKRERYMERIKSYKEAVAEISPDMSICGDDLEALKKEKELLGTFVSRNPLELYPSPDKCGATDIDKVKAGQSLSVMGVISDYTGIRLSKKNNLYLRFTLKDRTEKIDVMCFGNKCKDFEGMFEEDSVVKVTGKALLNEYEGKKELCLQADAAEPAKVKKSTVFIAVKDIDDWETRIKNIVKPYVSKNGNPVMLFDTMMGECRKCTICVTPDIVNNDRLKTKLVNL